MPHVDISHPRAAANRSQLRAGQLAAAAALFCYLSAIFALGTMPADGRAGE